MVIREKYLSKIRPFYEVDIIKAIVGIRRCGKSVILTQIVDEIKNKGIDNNHIIYLNFELKKYSNIKNDNDLDNYVHSLIKDKKKHYLFLDEIGKVKNWELAVNSFKAEYKEKISIFIAGSNSDLLSGELATNLSGRYVSFEIYPLSFKEVCELKKIKTTNKYELQEEFDNYLMWGGMPQRYVLSAEEEVNAYLTDVFNSIVIKDIIERYNIKDIDLFNRVVEYIMTTPSQTFSGDNLIKYLEEYKGVTKNTLYNYLEYMKNACLISKVERYDVRGKRILKGKYKYYLTDLGLGQVKNVGKKLQLGAYLENIVYNELKSRGYDVKIGTLKYGEIDFIATKFKDKKYFQVAYYLNDDSIEREFASFSKIEDNYPKYVISMDTIDLSQNGVIHKNIIDFLLDDTI